MIWSTVTSESCDLIHCDVRIMWYDLLWHQNSVIWSTWRPNHVIWSTVTSESCDLIQCDVQIMWLNPLWRPHHVGLLEWPTWVFVFGSQWQCTIRAYRTVAHYKYRPAYIAVQLNTSHVNGDSSICHDVALGSTTSSRNRSSRGSCSSSTEHP